MTRAYLQHGAGTSGPFLTESVPFKRIGGRRYVLAGSRWHAIKGKRGREFVRPDGQWTRVTLTEGVDA